jgi:hypothetical protein
MKKYYSQPDIQVRKYSVVPGVTVLTNSSPETDENDLNKDDNYNVGDIFGN